MKGDASSAGTSVRGEEFASMVPMHVDTVNVLSPAKKDAVWNKIYAAAGLGSGSEVEKKSLRCAVYVYTAVNGTSPSGEYTGDIRSSKGTTLAASALPTAAGQLNIRRFMRANARESLRFFRESRVLESRDELLAKCDMYGIRGDDAVALCDWFDTTVGLTPREQAAQASIKNFSLKRARAARGGKSVETVREELLDDNVEAQGDILPKSANGW